MDELLKEHNYRVQEDIHCCRNCGNHDIAVDINDIEYALCSLYGDPVADLGICDCFEW